MIRAVGICRLLEPWTHRTRGNAQHTERRPLSRGQLSRQCAAGGTSDGILPVSRNARAFARALLQEARQWAAKLVRLLKSLDLLT